MSALDQCEKKFILQHNNQTIDQNLIKGEFTSHLGCKWKISCTSYEPGVYSMALECKVNRSNLWNINANLTFTIKKQDGGVEKTEKVDARFDAKHSYHGVGITSSCLEMNKIISIECLVEIKSIVGVHYKKHNFNKMDDNVNNTALVVEGKKIYVSKQILAMASPVLHHLFFSELPESKMTDVPIQDVSYDNMKNFLSVVYGDSEPCDATIDSLLQLSDRFDAQNVMKKCEKYLIGTTQVRKQEKLIYAEKYTLSELQSTVLDSLQFYELREFVEDNSEFGEATLRELLRLSAPFMFQDQHSAKRNGKGKGTIFG